RAGRQTRQTNRAISLVREQETLAKGNRDDAEERLQARSGSPDQQRHQLCYGRIRAGPVEGERVPGLSLGNKWQVIRQEFAEVKSVQPPSQVLAEGRCPLFGSPDLCEGSRRVRQHCGLFPPDSGERAGAPYRRTFVPFVPR